ncbi:hypothetical protein FBQ99_20555 [Chloroflexi bacterium CFX2]|nr:hypothetical protein [Chloroflexi bacterium CFX2]
MPTDKQQPDRSGNQATIPDHRIRNFESFKSVTSEPRQVAGLYFYLLLDCMVELSYKISQDFFKRPHLYTILGKPSIAPIIAKLNAHYGSDERVASKPQRGAIFAPVFGSSTGYAPNENGDFPRLRDQLVNAAAAFAERVYDTGVDMLRERLRTTHRPFKEYLMGLFGDSVKWSKEESLSDLTENMSYKILRHERVAAIFGISTPPKAEWPYTEDSNGDKLVEEISRQLKWPEDSQAYVTREFFSNLQRTALRGTEAIATIIDYEESSSNGDLDLLITKCYSWGSALGSISNYSPSKPSGR